MHSNPKAANSGVATLLWGRRGCVVIVYNFAEVKKKTDVMSTFVHCSEEEGHNILKTFFFSQVLSSYFRHLT